MAEKLEAKTTPGAWEGVYRPLAHCWEVYGNGKLICTVDAQAGTDEDKANLQLILDASVPVNREFIQGQRAKVGDIEDFGLEG